MDLEKLSDTLKRTASEIDCFILSAEHQSGQDSAIRYVKENQLDYISDEILKAYHAGFIYALQQIRNGKIKSEKLS